MRRAAVVLFAFALASGVAVYAQDRVLHEFIPDAREDEGSQLVAQGGQEPAAIVAQGEVLAPPEGGALTPDERPMVADPGDGQRDELPGVRSPAFRPDRITELEGTLGYYEVFTPTITPFKRVTALDGVTLDADGLTPLLAVADATRRPLRVEGADAAPPDARPRDKFWGNVVLDFSAGQAVPLPTVSPESRLLTVRTEPQASLRFERDSADNVYAVAVVPVRDPVRVVFLTDAPRDYFAAPIPDARVDVLSSEVRPLPPSVQRRALGFAADLGLRPGASSLRTALEALTGHFRAFVESSEPPRDTGDIFLDLARGGRGVCRHRAYAFVITAQALGIPARFVQNEAHAWAEVHLPRVGWMRVDLGGAANGLEAHNTSDAPLYQPANEDELPHPRPFEHSYSTLRGDVQGLRPEDRRRLAGANGTNGTNGANGANLPNADGPPTADGPPGTPNPAPTTTPRPAPGDRRTATTIAVHQFYREVYRGRELLLTGRVADAQGAGLEGQRVEVSLQAPRGDRAMLLGVTVTRPSGDFRASFGVPPDLPVGNYRLQVVAPGDARHLPAVAE